MTLPGGDSATPKPSRYFGKKIWGVYVAGHPFRIWTTRSVPAMGPKCRRETSRYCAAKSEASLIDCRLKTGRTHQIRVHFAAIGHPLLGDRVYGAGFKTKSVLLPPAAREALAALSRQALHAYLLAIEHPVSGKELVFRSDLPPELARLRQSLAEGTTASGLRFPTDRIGH